jgi:hypothetical protein
LSNRCHGAALGAAHRHARGLRAVVALAFALQLPAVARAYTYESPVSAGCHEAISLAALHELRAAGAAAPLSTSARDRLWIDDLPLELPRGARDLAAAALVVGVRDNDLKGRHGLDTSELPQVHGDPDLQAEHCLRRPEHDEPGGSAAALRECRAFIRDKVSDALRGLDARGLPDPDARIAVAVDLTFAGAVRVSMPRFYVQLGRALHALQDSFSHALRSEDGMRVRALLNWVDVVAERHDERRDGPAHRGGLDDCEHLDDLRALRRSLAIAASSELLSAALDARGGPDARLRAADRVLDRYMSFEPGCDADNAFCGAPELAYASSAGACAAVPGRAGSSRPVFTCALGFWLLSSVRRRSARARRVLGLAALLLVATSAPRTGLAQSDEPRGARAAVPAKVANEFALAAEFGAAIDQAAAAVTAGARYRAAQRWLLGGSLEWNPWASLETRRVRAGTLNAYGSAIWRAPLTGEVALRISGHLGAALLLFDLYGAPSGSVGPYLGVSLLALELGLSRNLLLVLEPADVVVTIPQVTGIPLTRRQYRASLGLELWL